MDIKNTGQMELYTRFQLDRTDKSGAPNPGAPAQSSTALTPKSDTVTVSNEAVLRTDAYRTAMATPPVRQEKVDAIKSQIQNGSYTIDSRRIATKLLTEEAVMMKG